MQQEGRVLPLQAYILEAVHHEMGIHSSQLIVLRWMFTKLKQRSWLKIEAGRSKTEIECYRGLIEVCGTAAIPYRTVARWVQAFRAGRQNATDQPRPGPPSATEGQVTSLATLLETDRRWTIRELACETGLSHTPVLHILKERLHVRKIASRWVPYSLTEIQK